MTESQQFHPFATRVEVIDESGRSFVGQCTPGVTVVTQDDGRTVKVFASGRPTSGGDDR